MDIDELAGPDDVPSVGPETLVDRLARGDRVSLLDVRSESEYDRWHVEGETVDVVHVPYYEFLEGVDEELLARLPRPDDGLVVVCTKGGASAYVVGLLEDEGIEALNLDGGMNAWARVYDVVEVSRYGGPGRLFQYRRPSSGCLAYAVVHDGEVAVVDPLRAFVDRYLDDARAWGAELVYAIDTHVHADHVSGVQALAARGVDGVVPEPSVARGVDYDVDYATVADGETLTVGGVSVEAVHTPGHTAGMTSYLVDGRVLLTGDCLFLESVGSPDPEGGEDGAPDAVRRLYDSIHRRILRLPDDVLVAPGHFGDAGERAPDGTYTATLGDLRDRMPSLGMGREAFVASLLSDAPPRPRNFADVVAVNLGRTSVDDDAAFELELGPNNCAVDQRALGD